jgi:hypothetical protein
MTPRDPTARSEFVIRAAPHAAKIAVVVVLGGGGAAEFAGPISADNRGVPVQTIELGAPSGARSFNTTPVISVQSSVTMGTASITGSAFPP